jgi:hypothetical protein
VTERRADNSYRRANSLSKINRLVYIMETRCLLREVSVLFVCVIYNDRLCGLVIIVPGYRSRGPGSNLGATRFPEQWV